MDIKPNILATLAYYDVLDMPLRPNEVLNKLASFLHLANRQLLTVNYQPLNLGDIERGLDQLVLDGIVGRAGEYYSLFDREYLVPLRLKREKLAKHKWQKAKRAIRWLCLVPYVEAVFASGSLAINNTDELSDLDVLIVVKHGRIWLARLWITALLSTLGMRRRGSDRVAPDKICLNHYITDKSLYISAKSIYTAQTYANLVPINLRNAELIQEFKNKNRWVLDFVFNWNVPDKPIIKNGWLEILARLVETALNTELGGLLEKLAKRLQYRRIDLNPVTKQAGGRVIFNDEQLEFHPHSIEASIIKKYNDNLVKLGMAELAIEHDSGLNH